MITNTTLNYSSVFNPTSRYNYSVENFQRVLTQLSNHNDKVDRNRRLLMVNKHNHEAKMRDL